METYKTKAVVREDRSLTLDSLPFEAGETVEVTVVETPEPGPGKNRYPLRGTPYRYDEPFEPVAEADWEAVR